MLTELKAEVATLRAKINGEQSARNPKQKHPRPFSRPNKYRDREDRYPIREDFDDNEVESQLADLSGTEREWSPDRYLSQRRSQEIRIPEIIPSDLRFTKLVSWRRYRLNDRNSDTGPDISRNVRLWTRRLKSVTENNIQWH
eukprot:IDg7627t1